MNSFFNLYANCIPVQGNQESIIVDLQNNEYINIPNLFFEVLKKNRNKTVNETKKFFNDDLNKGIDHYFKYLNKIDYGFFLDNIESFPDLDLNWYSPLRVNNAILEINENCNYDFNSAIKELSSLGCSSLQIRINKSGVNGIILEILEATRMSRIRSVEIFLPEHLFEDSFSKYLDDIENRILTLLIHSVNDEELKKETYKNSKLFKQKQLVFTSKSINSSTADVIKKENFITNMTFFSEAQKFNVGLNRKVCIDNEGNFKNFLTHKSTHGNFKNKSITKLIDDPDFTRKWFVSNDDIEICKDCQFRYICMDNSELEFSNSSWKKLNQCPFDPYTNEWKIE
ncbi:grasp-with-spasm system SPASM domain peptide maturase [Chryseobacterium limigenitum]|uniref:SPASM domain peptide maturase, grasp-with-spasm system n=1 Tax=Chryseobacterium limigenitum TaxID=1612149 RepID=A0A1K2ITY2_9FLAO|nr:grasp-with-spasm system SPASM domain peptide maturase [Chryseobacterium limigenitum]SFZ95900.1 SPASM domain peptide maturase, grasp-with-spasm system [Chryseobacterium limigenitum]